MSNKHIWFISGASRSMGINFAKATLSLVLEEPAPAGSAS
jgi:hypothetical protein